MITYFISLGSNMGNREGHIQGALTSLAQHPAIVKLQVSDLLETEPWGNIDQEPFINGVCSLVSYLQPEEILKVLQGIERAHGRQRLVHWGPRTLDLDIIWAQEGNQPLEVHSPSLDIPHPYFWNRTFVLVPLSQLWADFSYQGQAIQERIKELEKDS